MKILSTLKTITSEVIIISIILSITIYILLLSSEMPINFPELILYLIEG